MDEPAQTQRPYIRRQGAILDGSKILLIQHSEFGGRSYWLLPGGGLEKSETEQECVAREMREETGLYVQVQDLLLEIVMKDGILAGDVFRTWRCSIVGGQAAPGYEPEPIPASRYAITAIQWLDLREPASWSEEIHTDTITYTQLIALRKKLEFTTLNSVDKSDVASADTEIY
jgi:8-oxo-dGTP diphosphatase